MTGRRTIARLGALLVLCTLLAAPSALPRARMIPVLAAGSCTTSRSSTALDSEEQDLLTRINNYRSLSGLAPLALSPTLMASAIWKSNDLGANGYFAHDDLTRSWTQRFTDCGYTATPNVAENLAAGNVDGSSTFLQWQTSAAHNANLLSPTMRAVGLARAYTAGSPYGWYWTADFGAAIDNPATAAPSASPTGPPQGSASSTSGSRVQPAPAAANPTPAASGTPSQAGHQPLSPGATALVVGTGDCLRVHAQPTLSANSTGCLPDGSAMVVADGPRSADGYTWWRLGALGWAVDAYLSALP